MDLRLGDLLPGRGHTFLEAGCHDGYTLSNTYYLERQLGWTGLLIDAVPELCDKARRRRPSSQVVHAALVAPEREGEEIAVHFGDVTSTIGELDERGLTNSGLAGYETSAPGRTLSSILDETGLGAPDLMILDLEGHELEALRGLDLTRHVPELILVELLDMGEQRPAFDRALGDRYVFEEALSPFDALYRRLG